MLGGIFNPSAGFGRPGMLGSLTNTQQGGAAGTNDPYGMYAVKDGGMDVMGTFQKQNEELNNYLRNPGAQGFGGWGD